MHSHTYSDDTGIYDVLRLIEMVGDRVSEEVPLNSLKPVSRSKRDGFSSKRLLTTDTSYPILVQDNQVIDGRHRVVKLMDAGACRVRVIRVTPEELEMVRIL